MNHNDMIKLNGNGVGVKRLVSESTIPSVIQNGRLLVRGSQEWENREIHRLMAGCCCISSGTIDDALKYEKATRHMHKLRSHIVRR